jgi:hypothetical protein
MDLLYTDKEEIKLHAYGENQEFVSMSVSKIYNDYTTQFFSFNLTIDQVKEMYLKMGRFIHFHENLPIISELLDDGPF